MAWVGFDVDEVGYTRVIDASGISDVSCVGAEIWYLSSCSDAAAGSDGLGLLLVVQLRSRRNTSSGSRWLLILTLGFGFTVIAAETATAVKLDASAITGHTNAVASAGWALFLVTAVRAG